MNLDDVNMDLFEPFSRLVEIEFLGRRVEVPENNTLLRCFQFLSAYSISYGKFCWNDECGNCECRILFPGAAQPVTRRTCQTVVEAGMKVVATSAYVKVELR